MTDAELDATIDGCRAALETANGWRNFGRLDGASPAGLLALARELKHLRALTTPRPIETAEVGQRARVFYPPFGWTNSVTIHGEPTDATHWLPETPAPTEDPK